MAKSNRSQARPEGLHIPLHIPLRLPSKSMDFAHLKDSQCGANMAKE
jgi:hypothetical protein